jgi:hypothetical protein
VIEAFSGFFALERRAQNDGKGEYKNKSKSEKQVQKQKREADSLRE